MRAQLLYLLLLVPALSFAQHRITGTITDAADGKSLAGVSITGITSSGSLVTISTNTNGEYALTSSERFIRISCFLIGYESKSLQIDGGNRIDIAMEANNTALTEVVVTALGISRDAKALSYSRQSMNTENLTSAPTTNIVSTLSGRIAGVQITPPSTNTGSARIVIRGNNSITGNNQPLFVIDGVPVDNEVGDSRLTTSGNNELDYGNVAANINPEDIEDIEVLKGPNAAALYGSRAANGAVLITTKKSKGEKFTVTVNSNATFQRISEFPEYQNMFGAGNSFRLEGSGSTNNPDRIPDLSVFYRSWGAPMLGQPVYSINGGQKSYLPQPNNVKDFYQTAGMFTNSISFDGGNKENNYRLSYTNFNGGSIVKDINTNKRHNVNLRLFNSFTKWLTMDAKLTYIHNEVRNRQYMNGSTKNPIYQYAFMVRDDQLSEFQQYKDEYGNEINTHREFLNPYWAINENPNRDQKNQFLGAFNLNAQLNDWLSFTTKFGSEMYWMDGYVFNNRGAQSDPDGSMNTFNNSMFSTNIDAVLFAKNRVGRLGINSFVGVGQFNIGNKRNRQNINSLIQPGLINLSNSSEFPSVSQFESEKTIRSVYGNVSLDYNNYLFVDITARNDWSSTLPTVNNAYFYPSIGGAFVFTEAFSPLKSDVFSFGKLRASYAIVGNDTDPYQLVPTYSFNGIYNGQAYASLSPTYYNPDLKPEKTASMEFGVDLKFLRNRLTLDVTYYNSSTTNQILSAQITPTSGFQRRFYNAGEIRNSGTEYSIYGAPIKREHFSWSIVANFAKNHSNVVSLIDGTDRFQLNTWFGRSVVYAEVGHPYGNIRGRGWKRDEQGRKLVDAAGLPITEPNVFIGNSLPDWTGGLSNTFSYKNMDLSFLLDIRKGGSFYSGTYRRTYIAGNNVQSLEGREAYYLHSYIYGETAGNLRGGYIYEDTFFEDGTPNNRYVSTQSNGFSNVDELQMFDASYIKLREVVLGFAIPKTLFDHPFFSSAKISVSGRNLWTIHKNAPRGIDPEASVTSGNGQGIEYGSLPPAATYGIDLRLTF